MNKLEMINTLKTITQRLGDEPIRWAVGFSSALVLHGIDIDPQDIDIVADKQGAFAINKLLNNYVVNPVAKGSFSEQFDSFFGLFEIGGCSIEVMGSFKFKSCINNKWYSFDKMFNEVEIISFDNVRIPVISLDCLVNIYKKMGRDKDLSKVNLIKEKKY